MSVSPNDWQLLSKFREVCKRSSLKHVFCVDIKLSTTVTPNCCMCSNTNMPTYQFKITGAVYKFIFNKISLFLYYFISFSLFGLVVSFSLGHDFKILRQNNKCLELFWPYPWSNAFGIQWFVTSVNEGYSTKNLAINVWKS
jgi:hypothetical protein